MSVPSEHLALLPDPAGSEKVEGTQRGQQWAANPSETNRPRLGNWCSRYRLPSATQLEEVLRSSNWEPERSGRDPGYLAAVWFSQSSLLAGCGLHCLQHGVISSTYHRELLRWLAQ